MLNLVACKGYIGAARFGRLSLVQCFVRCLFSGWNLRLSIYSWFNIIRTILKLRRRLEVRLAESSEKPTFQMLLAC
jgi:hypothetical protein